MRHQISIVIEKIVKK